MSLSYCLWSLHRTARHFTDFRNVTIAGKKIKWKNNTDIYPPKTCLLATKNKLDSTSGIFRIRCYKYNTILKGKPNAVQHAKVNFSVRVEMSELLKNSGNLKVCWEPEEALRLAGLNCLDLKDALLLFVFWSQDEIRHLGKHCVNLLCSDSSWSPACSEVLLKSFKARQQYRKQSQTSSVISKARGSVPKLLSRLLLQLSLQKRSI